MQWALFGDLPPEELAGHRHTPRSDLYGLGLLTFELLTGQRPPMDGSLPLVNTLRPELPTALNDVVARATGKPVQLRIAEFHRVRDGKIRETTIYYWDTAAMLAALTP